MKKLVSLLALCLILSFSAIGVSAEEVITVKLNGTALQFDQNPVMTQDRVLVPFRTISEALNATVTYDEATQTVVAISGENVVILQIGSDKMFVNSEEIKLDVPATEINGRTLIPTRAFSEALKCKVDWDEPSNTVLVTK